MSTWKSLSIVLVVEKTRRSALNYFFKKFGYKKDIFEITKQDLFDYHRYLKKLKVSLNTKKLKWAILVSFLKTLMEEKDLVVYIPKKTINWNGYHERPNSHPESKIKIAEEMKILKISFIYLNLN